MFQGIAWKMSSTKIFLDANYIIFDFLDRMVGFMTIIPLDEGDYKRMVEFMFNYGLKPSDALHVSTMSKAKTSRIITEDGEFDSVEWIKRIWLGKEEL